MVEEATYEGAIEGDSNHGVLDGGVEVLGGEDGGPPEESLQLRPDVLVRVHLRRVGREEVHHDPILVLGEPASRRRGDVRRVPVEDKTMRPRTSCSNARETR